MAAHLARGVAAVALLLSSLGSHSGCNEHSPIEPMAPTATASGTPQQGRDAAASASREEPSAHFAAGTAPPGCTIEGLQSIVSTRTAEITACYKEALKSDTSFQGRLVVELTIAPGGKLVRRSVYESDLPLSLNECAVRALANLQFEGNFDKPCIILYPFSFTAAPPARQ